ncbi:MAG: PA14 domain-containing protein, partial [Bacteroidales bacterium]|nr:PA14 domain-containing protein [Bacteroidales bacterium]
YVGRVALQEGLAVTDQDEKVFGFRWFAPEGIGQDAVFRLNGKRIVLRTAISWGFWPVTGLIATPEMAKKQILTAKQLGLNMLSFHRCIGSPVVLEAADELGLLYYEEPGGFQSIDNDPFIHAVMHEKVMRMVQRDRSHPSLILFNMINEYTGKYNKDTVLLAKRLQDMADGHALDPSRTFTFTSGWASSKKDADDISKAHLRPFDNRIYQRGWFDSHRADGPETWKESYYKSPDVSFMFTDNKTEIYMRGEEGALSTPPRIAAINKTLEGSLKKGWDGPFWQKQYQSFADMFESKGLKPYFGSVDALTVALGNISFEHQGRRIQGMRMLNVGDCYAINGWESMPFDNHSGVVDIYRNSKGNSDILAYYNQPAYVAVVPRQQVLRLPAEVTVDFYAVNEINIKGPQTLHISVKAPDGKEIFAADRKVILEGGDTYGQLLVENMKLPLGKMAGMCSIEASIVNASLKELAKGHDQVLTVEWDPKSFTGEGAIYDYPGNSKVKKFFKKETGRELSLLENNQKKLDWIIITRPPLDSPRTIEPEVFRTKDGKPGINVTFTQKTGVSSKVATRLDSKIDYTLAEGAQADPSLNANQSFMAAWEGNLIPPVSGSYLIAVSADNGVRLTVDGKNVIDELDNKNKASFERTIQFEAGKPVAFSVSYRQGEKSGMVQLQWSLPGTSAISPDMLFERAKRDGTKLIFLESSVTWLDYIAKNTGLVQKGYFPVGMNWVGGVQFVREHPLFKNLPVNTGLNWPYQAVVNDGNHRFGLRLEGEEMIVGAYKSAPFDLGTVVGVIPCGKGKIILSTLDIVNNLDNPSGPAEVARKLFCNYIGY